MDAASSVFWEIHTAFHSRATTRIKLQLTSFQKLPGSFAVLVTVVKGLSFFWYLLYKSEFFAPDCPQTVTINLFSISDSQCQITLTSSVTNVKALENIFVHLNNQMTRDHKVSLQWRHYRI